MNSKLVSTGHAAIVVCLLLLTLPSTTQTYGDDALTHFEKRVRPLLVERCFACHSPQKQKGGLRLDSREAMLRGGESGPAIVVGKPDESRLLAAVLQQNGLKMPPDGKLSETQIAALAEWIKAGAVWPATTTVTTKESTAAVQNSPQRSVVS